ncbi:hypothetical protein Q4485_03235 [Granulosicoccaceae sp. 1_MG-2023]|nr:hypothetical protein [Granulosicoccaceae sp. 1_MG-2023]
MKRHNLLMTGLCAALLSACSDSSDYDFDSSREASVADAATNSQSSFAPRYDPANGLLPFPDNLLFSGSNDGTLNIPVDDPDDFSDPLVALNALDGFSTSAPISVSMTQTIDPDTVVGGDTVRVFEVTLDAASGALSSIVRELGGDEIYATVSGDADDTIVILPLLPLTPATSYLVVLSNGISNTASPSVPADKSVSYYLTSGDNELSGELAALEPLRQLTASFEAGAVSAGIDEDDIILSWAFTTQDVQSSFDALKTTVSEQTITLVPRSLNSASLGEGFDGSADIYVGALSLPYYQNAPQDGDDSAVTAGFWQTASGGFTTRFDPAPQQRSTQTVPLLISVPAADEAPDDGWPVAIFQHGITRNRSDMLALADSMGKAGVALVAIDLPLHGITDVSNMLHADGPLMASLNASERHFSLDLQDNDSGQSGSDGLTDDSGSHFYNLANLLNARDNLRQSVSDLLHLRASLGELDSIGIDSDQVSFIGQSLGAITGTVFLAQDDTVGAAMLSVPGVGLAQLLANSATFGPAIESALSDAGISVGSSDYEQFLSAAQTVLDSGDPVNFAADAAALHPALLHEVIGGSGGSLPDQVIPNAIADAPLSGTEAQIRLMALPGITASAGDGSSTLSGAVRFIAGGHGSLLSPQDDSATTVEMQTQAASYLASGGTRVTLSDLSVIDTGE